MFLKSKTGYFSIFDSLMIIRDYTTFLVNQSLMVFPSASSVSAIIGVCKNIGIFLKDFISLMDIL
jgi:hypothetical protein